MSEKDFKEFEKLKNELDALPNENDSKECFACSKSKEEHMATEFCPICYMDTFKSWMV